MGRPGGQPLRPGGSPRAVARGVAADGCRRGRRPRGVRRLARPSLRGARPPAGRLPRAQRTRVAGHDHQSHKGDSSNDGPDGHPQRRLAPRSAEPAQLGRIPRQQDLGLARSGLRGGPDRACHHRAGRQAGPAGRRQRGRGVRLVLLPRPGDAPRPDRGGDRGDAHASGSTSPRPATGDGRPTSASWRTSSP